MNAIYSTCKREARYSLDAGGVSSHELLFCKRVVLQTVYLSVECCQRYDVSKSEKLPNDKDM